MCTKYIRHITDTSEFNHLFIAMLNLLLKFTDWSEASEPKGLSPRQQPARGVMVSGLMIRERTSSAAVPLFGSFTGCSFNSGTKSAPYTGVI